MTRKHIRLRTPVGSATGAEPPDHAVGRAGPRDSAPLGPAVSTLESRVTQARELENAGHVDRAIELYLAILREEPEHLGAHYALGQLYDRTGRHLEALEQFERAKRIDPDNVDLLVNHANVGAVLGRFEGAERDLRRAAKLDPTRAAVFETLGMMQFRRGLYAQAEQELRRAVELDPDSPTALHYRGEALNQLGRVDEAMAMLERAATIAPANPRTWYLMGILLDRKHRPQEAAAMFRKARALTPM
jgi:Flp pilus assembly protein TadD